MSHSEYSRCRILEDDLWNKYLEDDFSSKNCKGQMLIYHWKTKSEEDHIDHFSAFAKFTRRNVTNFNITCVILLIVSLSFVSGLLTNLAWSSMTKGVESSAASLANGSDNRRTSPKSGTTETEEASSTDGVTTKTQHKTSNFSSKNMEVSNND